jgi:aldehyde dehydrogenase (NAD+)
MTVLATLGITPRHSGTASGGGWLNSSVLLNSYSPIDDALLGSVEQTTAEQMDQVIAAAQQEFLAWRSVPAPKRGELIRLIGEKLRMHKDALGTLVSLEMGKSKAEGDGEVQEMIDMADLAVGQSRMLYGNCMHSERPLHRMYEQWHPLGVVGVISAFNFPVAVWAWNAFLAAVCGNTVIWKPSPKTPLCSIAVHKLCVEVFNQHGYGAIFSLINPADIELNRKFIDDCRIPLISFTGSTPVGREVGMRLAGRFARSLLELGGNNAVIIDPSADLATTLPAVTFAAIGTAGQRCTTLRRLIVHESIYQQTIAGLTKFYSQLKVGNPLDLNNHMGPLCDRDAVVKYEAALARVKQENGKIIFGGKVISGNYVAPTLIEAQPHWGVVKDETFAPILYIMPYRSLEEAISLNNQVEYGLSSAIFTNNIQTAEEFLSARGSDCGIANVNIGTSGAEIGGAFGGEKATGGGREAGSDAWKAYMRRQTNTINYGSGLTLAQGIKFNL